MSWQKVDEKTGAVVEEDDIVDNGEIPGTGDNQGGGSGSGDSGGGGDDNVPLVGMNKPPRPTLGGE